MVVFFATLQSMTEAKGQAIMARPEHLGGPEKGKVYPMRVINVAPGIPRPDMMSAIAEGIKVLVFIGHANGGIQGELLPSIRVMVQSGITVVGLSDNPGAGHGVVRYSDQPQVDARDAGVTYLEKPNITNLAEVVQAIQAGLDAGFQGRELSDRLKEQFAYAPDEERPVSELTLGVYPPQKRQ